ncbi:hypothetical protein [Sulfolobus acidocaldarius]|uniref:Conserved protein n=3 Tax=Sulfolobus acidocaldarius TaxID=2285 RepID=Q4JBC4_SULAC|nr:hypothetical protein [Sulfolobus acidocaldarius]AAY79905.1 conserved protein [Sulfolobus acidocaldarius DSM 639]AGE70471.1 hypothetical protein SacN8_02455 [Sulfolobus acidocaldarius N8]AGE72744.1 hypothetical protein SacRon12I_02445 [Sulfolobus acidocaldarius Ron12/I]
MKIEKREGEEEVDIIFESKEDLEEFRQLLIKKYYELNPDRKPPYGTQSSR